MPEVEPLFPIPQRIERDGAAAPVRGFAPEGDVSVSREVERLARELSGLGLLARGRGRPVRMILESGLRRQGFRLRISPDLVVLAGGALPGLRYGALALVDLLRHTSRDGEGTPLLPSLLIEDWPDFPVRGVMLDISRDRVPRMETLFDLIDTLAGWRYNQIQLYMEHTFAYRGHEVVWRDASPMRPDEIRILDAFCRERHMELVANQNSLGHFHRWLIHSRYRELAECPEGYESIFTPNGEPYSLCAVDPRALGLLEDLYDQLLPHFTSPLVNVGLDETFDLGLRRSAAACRERGTEEVYLEFVNQVHRLLAHRERRMLFWGDIILKRPELIRSLPQGAIALEWGYEADHPFAEDAAHFRAAGLDFYVCPGTSSWNSIAGRTDNALRNLAAAARHGAEAGAAGYLVTDWGDHGHWQPHPANALGLLAGAALSWNSGSAARLVQSRDPQEEDPTRASQSSEEREIWIGLLSSRAFADPSGTLGTVAYDLGNAYRVTGATNRNGSALFRAFHYAGRPFPHPEIEGLTRAGLERSDEWINAARRRIGQSRSSRLDAAWLQEEWEFAADLQLLGSRILQERIGAGQHGSVEGSRLSDLPRETRLDLIDGLEQMGERHSALWSRRSRPGGLRESRGRFGAIADLLRD
ncbi:MAG: family 20 glycosylhydrolase [Candidatus Eisenbacteria bacterium]|nr:family 20 glycosylhydrolase [Candidatus Eisenbacteria bacterium]